MGKCSKTVCIRAFGNLSKRRSEIFYWVVACYTIYPGLCSGWKYQRRRKAIKNYFDKEEIEYLIYCDDTTNDTQLAKIILNKIDIIVKSPGIKFDTVFLRVAEALNKKIISDIELYYQFFKPTDMVLVTGSVGKTTIATLISRMLSIKEEFKDNLQLNGSY